jgi:hypothetical protein
MTKNYNNLEMDLNLSADERELLSLLNRVIGNEYGTLFLSTEDWLSSKALIELSSLAKNATPAQQITIEDAVTCIVIKLLDYANTNVLKNFELYLQQESCPSKCGETGCDYVKGSRRGET